MLAKNTEH